MERMIVAMAAAWMLVSAPALAQRIPTPGFPAPGFPGGAQAVPDGVPGMPAGMQNYEAMVASLEAAQAAASRPGDERLSCDDLQAQVTEAMNDPAIAAWTATAGAAAQQELAAIQAAQDAATAAQTGASIAGAFIPGGNAAAMAAAVAQAQAAQARGAQHMQQRLQQMEQITTIMPQLMRGQRLVELAVMKNCDWVAGHDFTGAFSLPTGPLPAAEARQ
jgi:hypothetical protein